MIVESDGCCTTLNHTILLQSFFLFSFSFYWMNFYYNFKATTASIIIIIIERSGKEKEINKTKQQPKNKTKNRDNLTKFKLVTCSERFQHRNTCLNRRGRKKTKNKTIHLVFEMRFKKKKRDHDTILQTIV